MRTSLLRAQLAAAGAVFGARHGVEIAMRHGDRAEEYRAIREAAGLTDVSYVRQFRVRQEAGLDFLDGLVAGNVARIRFGRVLHTFLADAEGRVLADCYVANGDEDFLCLVEGGVEDAVLDAVLAEAGAGAVGLEDLTPGHALLSLDGFRAWEVARKLFGADVLGLPYLSIETYSFEGAVVRLFRAGKTSEFGYVLSVPAAVAAGFYEAVSREVVAVGGRACGVAIHDELRLEGRFFNVQAEGVRVGDPLVLGLQWMVDFEKPTFVGAAAIRARRAAGLREKVVGVAGPVGHSGFQVGDALVLESAVVGRVVAVAWSDVLGRPLGLAVLPVDLAYAGLPFRLGGADGAVVETLSMPPIMPRSLTVKLDEM